MNKYYNRILIIGGLLAVVITVCNWCLKTQADSISGKFDNFEQYLQLMCFREKQAIMNNGMKLSSELEISDINENLIYLTERVKAPMLVIKTSAMGCDLCLQEELKHIEKYISHVKENVIILASDCNSRTVRILKQSIQFDFEIFRIQKVGLPFEDNNHNLFIFVLGNDLVVKEFFIPEKTLPELSKNYYETICSKYW